MSGRFAELERPFVVPVTRSVPGFGGTQFLTAFSGTGEYVSGSTGGYSRNAFVSGSTCSFTLSTATAGISIGCTLHAGAPEYNLDFVSEVLAADAAEHEASFDNVVDMLDWLNRG
jgi:hypothetical protein